MIDEILEAFHHPWYANGRSRIQEDMFQALRTWVDGLENTDETIQALTKVSELLHRLDFLLKSCCVDRRAFARERTSGRAPMTT